MLSSTLSEHLQAVGVAAEGEEKELLPHVGAWPRPGRSPLVRDRSVAPRNPGAALAEVSGDNAGLWLKLEGLQPSGHVTDRIAAAAIVGALSNEDVAFADAHLLVAELGPLAISVVQHGVTARVPVTVLYRAERPELRLRALAAELGAELLQVPENQTRKESVCRWLEEHSSGVLVGADVVGEEPGRQLALELVQQLGEAPENVVLSTEATALESGLEAELGAGVCVIAPVGDPGTEDLVTTKQSLGGQGILVGPSGAAAVARARQLVKEKGNGRSSAVVAVLPDGGHRHLGWWPGWGLKT